jgi:hypothetical protein
MKKSLYYILLFFYYFVLIIFGALMRLDTLLILFLLYLLFSIIDIFVLKFLSLPKYLIIFLPYTLFSYLLCHYFFTINEQLHIHPLIASLTHSFIILIDYLKLNISLAVTLFIVFIAIKIIPHLIIITKIKKVN